MKLKAKASGEPIELWHGRLKAAITMFGRVRRERQEYERALALQDGVHDWARHGGISAAYAADKTLSEQEVPLSFRYAMWLQSQTAGDLPVIKYPRGAWGDELFATTMEELLTRVWVESGSHREWSQAIFDLCAFGSSCVWYGFHADLVTSEEVQGASEGVADTVARALHGDVEPTDGQDHSMAAKALDSALQDPVNRVALPLEAQVGLAQAATNQEVAGLEAMDAPDTPSVKRREIWSRRLQVGTQVVWDHTVSDLRDARWVARRIVMRVEDAQGFSGFASAARKRLGVSTIRPEDGIVEVMDVDGKPVNGPENGRFVCWQVWDKTYRSVHYVSLDMAEYLEVDESYPFPDQQTGEPGIPGFFPCVISAPIRHSREMPERTTGVPLIAPGYPLQRHITTLHRFAIESAKRHSVRIYEIPESLDPNIEAQIASGDDAQLVRRPPDIEAGGMVTPVQFTGEAYRIVELIENLTARWAMIQGFPLADLTSQPQADTATAEQLSVTAGRNQAEFVLRQVEGDMARGAEVLRAMLKIGLYPPERIAALIGPGREDVMAAWQASSLDGDMLVFKLASRAKADQAVRIKQLGDGLMLTAQFADPKTGLPMYDGTPIVEEIYMALDIGRPRRIQWTPEDIMLRMGLAGGGGGEGTDRGPGAAKRAQGPTDAAHEGAAARRVGK